MNWRLPTPKEVFVSLLLLFLYHAAYITWKDALSDPHRVFISEPKKLYSHAWRVKGGVRYAESIATSAPNYMGNHGFTTTGYNENGSMIWSVDECTSLEQIK